ncbi:M56 family metallopeptidase [Maribacter sp. SA7]|uniref:M56 family metallopeptidase n=1 Tax=Maribacter zhoushanensis TaxID=3030012 RepID=UPI0023ED5DE9|nr:M56 family metallopeptidase [Maribacter zhoushanensis]MDF4201938.1 M56 family metallopeptidase [Maribacter zhoushanensis]
MEIFLLKSTACMGIFLLFYKLLLEKESMHHFKRFFLLTALLASFIIPQVIFTEYVETVPTRAVTQVLTINEQPEIIPIANVVEESPVNWSLIFYSIYGLGVAAFAFRFLYNITKIWNRIRRNTQIKNNFLVKILLKEQLPPHTFLRFIFLNKQKFETKSIPNSVMLHEETHAKEWHSLDVIFMELLQVVFWFNPLIYLFKKTIKLNHEFLADSAVLNNQEDHLNYQNTLLSYLSNNSFNTHQSVGIANAINYSSTRLTVFGKTFTIGNPYGQVKKRFIIMKKQTSKKGILIRSLLLLPVLALMLYGFSQKNVVSKNTIKDINIEITKSGDLLINNEPVTLESLSIEVDRVNHNFGPYITRNYITAHILYDETQHKLIDQIEAKLGAIGISNIKHFSKRTTNNLGKNGFKPSEYHGKTIDEAKEIRKSNVYDDLKTDIYHEPLLEIAWIEVKNENEIWFNDEHVQLSQLNEKVKKEFPLAVKNNKLSAQIYTTENIHSDFTDAITKELRKLNAKSISVFVDQYIIHEVDSSNKFRSDNTFNTNSNRIIKLAGLVIDSETLEPLVHVEIKDNSGNVLTTTDNKGYYSLELNKTPQGVIHFDLTVQKEGYNSLIQKEHWGNLQGDIASSFFFGLQKNKGVVPEFSKLFTQNNNLDYTSVSKNIAVIENEQAFVSKLENAKDGNTNCIVEVNKIPYLVDATSWIKLNSKNDIIAINDKENIPASKLNGYISRNNIKAMSPLESYDTAKFVIYTTSGDINTNLRKRVLIAYNSLAKKYNAIPIEKRSIPQSDLKILESIYRSMSTVQRGENQPFPECLPKENQDGASEEQILQYNSLAKKYNTMISEGGNIRILKSDVDELTYIYGLMSAKQKENAAPFPDFPEPPPVPMAPKVPNIHNTPVESTLNFVGSPNSPKSLNTISFADKQLMKIISEQDPYDINNLNLKTVNGIPATNNSTYINNKIKNIDSTNQENTRVYIYNADTNKKEKSLERIEYLRSLEKQNAQFFFEGKRITAKDGFQIIESEENIKIQTLPYTNKQPEVKIYKKSKTDLIPPPSPPTPPSPLDYAIGMAKKGAKFLYEDKEISSDQAIDLLKNNKELNIESRDKNGKAEVRITKEPVTIN